MEVDLSGSQYQADPGQSGPERALWRSQPAPRSNRWSDSDHVAEFTRVYERRLEAFDYDPKAQAMTRVISERQRLVQELAATKNRIHEQVLVCFPEFTQVFADPFAKLARAVLSEIPTARRAARRQALSLARVKSVAAGSVSRSRRAQQLILLAKQSIASAGEDDDAEAMGFLLDQLELLEKRLTHIERTLVAYVQQAKAETETPEEGVSAARQVELLDSIPGIAIVSAATLVLGTRGLARFVSGKALSAQWASCPERTKRELR